MPTSSNSSSTYRLDRRLALQFFGWRMIFAGVAAMLAFFSFDTGDLGRTVGWILLILTVSFLAAAIKAMAIPPLVVRLDAQGFRLGRSTRSGIRRAHWTTVETAETAEGPAGIRLVFRLQSGKSAHVPLVLVARRADELQLDVHTRLNTAHGYRPLT
jgi:hypothetical protein